MAKKPLRLSDQIRSAIDNCGQSRYAIWKATGIAQSTLSEFMAGRRTLSMANLDILGEYLGLTITMTGTTNTRKGG